jgi:hypothetical protein
MTFISNDWTNSMAPELHKVKQKEIMLCFEAFAQSIKMPWSFLIVKGKTIQMTLKNLGNALFIIFLCLAFISTDNAQTKRKAQRAKAETSLALQKQITVPSDLELQTLIKATFADFAGSIDKGDFSNFYGKTADDFKQGISLPEFTNTFQRFIQQKDAFLPILKATGNVDAIFSTVPEIATSEYGYKILVLKGEMKSQSNLNNFETEYKWENNRWKLIKIKVLLSSK